MHVQTCFYSRSPYTNEGMCVICVHDECMHVLNVHVQGFCTHALCPCVYTKCMCVHVHSSERRGFQEDEMPSGVGPSLLPPLL